MSSLLVNDAADYNAATDRINSALQVLRDEMKSLRHQDVTLMSQFITMNDKIRSLSKGHKSRQQFNKSSSAQSDKQSTKTKPSRSITEMRKRRMTRRCDVIPEERDQYCSNSSDDDSDASSFSGSMTSLEIGASFWKRVRSFSSSESDDSDSQCGTESEEENV